MLRTMIATKDNYYEVIEWIESCLRETNETKNDILRTELFFEECFNSLKNLSNNNEHFTAKLTIKKQILHAPRLIIQADGEKYDPFNKSDTISFDSEDYYMSIILSKNKNQMDYHWENNQNVITIKVRQSDGNELRNILAGIALGLLFGFGLKAWGTPEILGFITYNIFNSIETIFINLLLLFATPLIFLSIIEGIANISDLSVIRRIGSKLILISLSCLSIFVILGLFIGSQLGTMPELLAIADSDVSSVTTTQMSIRDMFLGIIPDDFLSPFVNKNFLQILFLACLFGIMLINTGNTVSRLKEDISFLNKVLSNVLTRVMNLVPLVVASSMAKLVISTELSVFLVFGKILIAVILLSILCVIIFSIIVAGFAKVSPFPFLRKIISFSVLPFSTQSSSGCLSETLKFCSTKLGTDKGIGSFTIPLGIQLNLVGSGSYIAAVSMLMAKTIDIPLTMEFILTFFVVIVIMTLAAPGVSGGDLIIIMAIFNLIGVSPSIAMLLLGINVIVDMFVTAENVISNIAVTFILSHMENKIDTHVYNA